MTLTRLAASLICAALSLGGCATLLDGRDTRIEAAAEAAHPPEGRFVEVDGQRVHYVQMGRGPDLVLLHGASGNTRDMTMSFTDRVRDRYRVTVFDRPGLGYSDRVSPAFADPSNTAAETPQQQAAFLHAAAKKLGIVRPVVMGHSFGGAVALAWGLAHDPAALVIVSGATEPWPGTIGPLNPLTASGFGGAQVVPLITAFTPPALVRKAVETIFAPQDPPPDYVDRVGAPLALRRDSFRANARQIDALRPALVEMSRDYPTLAMPVEIVHGNDDRVVPIEVHADVLAGQIPDAVLTRLPGIGHMPHHVAPEAVVAAIDRAAARAGLR